MTAIPTSTHSAPAVDEQKLQDFLQRLVGDLAACSAGFMTHLGH